MALFSAGADRTQVFFAREAGSPMIWLNTYDRRTGAAVFDLLRGGADFTLVVTDVPDWKRDMTPWRAPSPFGGTLAGGAEVYLSRMTEKLAAIEAQLPAPPCWRGIAGYSLGGLFALYAALTLPLFSRVASVSGSLWFPGILAYAQQHSLVQGAYAYFSLGEREARTRNRVLRTVEEQTSSLVVLLRGRGARTAFVHHPGGHTSDSLSRTAAGLAWLLDAPHA